MEFAKVLACFENEATGVKSLRTTSRVWTISRLRHGSLHTSYTRFLLIMMAILILYMTFIIWCMINMHKKVLRRLADGTPEGGRRELDRGLEFRGISKGDAEDRLQKMRDIKKRGSAEAEGI